MQIRITIKAEPLNKAAFPKSVISLSLHLPIFGEGLVQCEILTAEHTNQHL